MILIKSSLMINKFLKKIKNIKKYLEISYNKLKIYLKVLLRHQMRMIHLRRKFLILIIQIFLSKSNSFTKILILLIMIATLNNNQNQYLNYKTSKSFRIFIQIQKMFHIFNKIQIKIRSHFLLMNNLYGHILKTLIISLEKLNKFLRKIMSY